MQAKQDSREARGYQIQLAKNDEIRHQPHPNLAESQFPEMPIQAGQSRDATDIQLEAAERYVSLIQQRHEILDAQKSQSAQPQQESMTPEQTEQLDAIEKELGSLEQQLDQEAKSFNHLSQDGFRAQEQKNNQLRAQNDQPMIESSSQATPNPFAEWSIAPALHELRTRAQAELAQQPHDFSQLASQQQAEQERAHRLG